MIINDLLPETVSSILIVDDNPQNLEVLGKMLQDNSYEIEFAINGEAALEWLECRRFDLILLDINMPGMNGFDVFVKIRQKPELNDVPLFFLSAETDRETILKGFELGAQDYITKPFDSRELLMRVRTHIALKEMVKRLKGINTELEKIVEQRTLQLKEANERLVAMNVKLTDLDKEKSDFLSLISHQIRTPLNGIIVSVELLKGPVYAKEIGELVELLDSSVKRLENYALDALLITRLKINPKIIKEKLNLSELINEVLKNENITSLMHDKKFVFNDKGENQWILGEPALIKKCFINIIGHLLAFSGNEEIIRIRTYIENQEVICEFITNHSTIPQEISAKMFRLFTPHSEYNDSYTGIDLPIAKLIMETHGGKIVAGNIEGDSGSIKLIFKQENSY